MRARWQMTFKSWRTFLTVSENQWYESRCIPYFIDETIWNPFKLPFSWSCLSKMINLRWKKIHFQRLNARRYLSLSTLPPRYLRVVVSNMGPWCGTSATQDTRGRGPGCPSSFVSQTECRRAPESGARFWVQTSTASKSSHDAPKKDRTTMDIQNACSGGCFTWSGRVIFRHWEPD